MKSLFETIMDAVKGWGVAYLLGPRVMGFIVNMSILAATVLLFYLVSFIVAMKSDEKPEPSKKL
jgi:hypothetical protein